MKKIIQKTLVFVFIVFLTSGCDKFLNLEPIDNVSGNNFWTLAKNAEAHTQGLYAKFRSKTCATSSYFPAFDLRNGPHGIPKGGNKFLRWFAQNDIKSLMKDPRWNKGLSTGGGPYIFKSLSVWDEYYEIIQGANILIKEIDKVTDLSEKEKTTYIAEAVFMRNLCYFFMVRLYGAVPYYTKAYHNDLIGRTPMVQVLKRCVADLESVKEYLPWTYSDKSKVAIRAMRGGAIALLMHMNMWLAGFDEENKSKYYEAVKLLGEEITSPEGNAAYGLVPINNSADTKKLFKGRTREGLFEVLQNQNYGEGFPSKATMTFYASHFPYKGNADGTGNSAGKSLILLNEKYVERSFPEGVPDRRLELWYENPTEETFILKKFINTFIYKNNMIENDDNMMVFRLADVYLLMAEALAELNELEPAKIYLNRVRVRAGAPPIQSAKKKELKDQIFLERGRELYGEGHTSFDLIRTKRILDENFCFYPITLSDFNQGAWTWPIDESVLEGNPKMTLNEFWR